MKSTEICCAFSGGKMETLQVSPKSRRWLFIHLEQPRCLVANDHENEFGATVDYFGPLVIKDGPKELKHYGVLLTCMTSRAIHLETSNSLEADSFINALRQFISRQGPILQLRTDQATNFMRARKELIEALAEMDQERILKQSCWRNSVTGSPSKWTSHLRVIWEVGGSAK